MAVRRRAGEVNRGDRADPASSARPRHDLGGISGPMWSSTWTMCCAHKESLANGVTVAPDDRRRLFVLVEGRRAALIRIDGSGRLVLTYDEAWRHDPSATP